MTPRFQLHEPPPLSSASFDRADEIRDNVDRLWSRWPNAWLLLIDSEGRYPVNSDASLRWIEASSIAEHPPIEAIFLGVAGNDRWTLQVGEIAGPVEDPRRGAHRLGAGDAGLLATALGILNWHASALHSPRDGSATQPARGGWVRKHTLTGQVEFPRIDPAVITLVHDGLDHLLLGRQATWPVGQYSTLAGFVEPGESLEQCVIREVREEVGIIVADPQYLGSQPWPFTRSLMLGFEAIGDRSQRLHFTDGEIGDAAWFHREEIREALNRGEPWIRPDDPPHTNAGLMHSQPRLPGSLSIARSMISSWANDN